MERMKHTEAFNEQTLGSFLRQFAPEDRTDAAKTVEKAIKVENQAKDYFNRVYDANRPSLEPELRPPGAIGREDLKLQRIDMAWNRYQGRLALIKKAKANDLRDNPTRRVKREARQQKEEMKQRVRESMDGRNLTQEHARSR